MTTTTLFLKPETLMGTTVAYHPFNDVLVAAGSVGGDAAVVWMVPQFGAGTPEDKIPRNPGLVCSNNILQRPQRKVDYFPSAPELTLPLCSIACAKFSPCGRYLAIVGTDTDAERLMIYSVHFPGYYSEIGGQPLLKQFLMPNLQ